MVVYSFRVLVTGWKGIRMHRLLITGLATLAILPGCGRDNAQQSVGSAPPAEAAEISSKDFGDYVLYFNAMSTDQLEPDIARAYGIARSKNRAMLTVSIIRNTDNGVGTSTAGTVDATAANLTGQIKNLTLRQIQEGEAIYFIGDVAVANGETLVFDISATPMNETQQFSVRFSRQFFAD